MGHGIGRLSDDKYVEWSTVVDAPITYVLDRRAAAKHFGEDRVQRADSSGHSYLDHDGTDYLAYNRAWPNECCITRFAIARRYESEGAYRSFKLEIKDIQPYINCWTDGETYWVPWKPGNEPPESSFKAETFQGCRELVVD